MKKACQLVLASVFAVSAAIALSACSKQERITVAIPNDTTNEARALLLLQENGLITPERGSRHYRHHPGYRLQPSERHLPGGGSGAAAQCPQDVDYAVINSNYAIEAGIHPWRIPWP